jgi:radical SAM protein with 4Fe4S-binding SPASM domain
MNKEHRPSIKTVWLVLNYRCNNRCVGCYAMHSGFTDQSMDLDETRQIVSWMKDLGARDCLLIGGEPTLYKQISRLILEGSAIGVEFKLVTNGRRLSDRSFLEALIRAGLKHASISLEGANRETHDQITGTPSYDEVISAIENCLRLGLSFNTLMTISRRNFAEIISLAEKLHEMGVKNILYNIGLPSPGTEPRLIDEFVLSPSRVAEIISGAYRELKAKGIKVKFFGTIPLCFFDEAALNEMMADGSISDGVHCHIFYGSGLVFEPNGNVLPCTHFVGNPLFNWKEQGVTISEGFAQLWYGEYGIHGTFRKEIWRYPHKNCRGCRHWGKCVGGCPFLWTHFDPSMIGGGTT